MGATLTKKWTILVVEDDHDVNDLVCDALDEAGYNVHSAFDGDEAMNACSEMRPDVILMDIILPDRDGIELCRALSQNEDTRSIPVIMLTGKQDLSSKLSSYIAGARRYITKPFAVDDLIYQVQRTIHQQQSDDI